MSDENEAEAKDSGPSTGADSVHRRVKEVVNDLLGRRVSPSDRADIRGAVDKADAPNTGRAGSDEGVGRALGKS